MENKKMTKKEKFAMLMELTDNEMLIEFIQNEINLLNKKSSSSAKTQTQKDNENIKENIILALKKIGTPVTITELQKADSHMAQYSNQKLSALITQLVNDKRIIKAVDKKKSYFKAV